MRVKIERSIGGGYGEALGVKKDLNKDTPKGKIWLCDGSSQVPNCRPVELFLTIWAAWQFGPSHKIVTDVMSSGVVLRNNPAETAPYWSLTTDTERFFLIPQSHVVPNENVLRHRREKLEEIAEILRSELGAINTDNIEIEDGTNHVHTRFWEAAHMIPSGNSIGTVACLPCSVERGCVMQHFVKFEKTLKLTDHRHLAGAPLQTKCLGEKRFQQIVEHNPPISELVHSIGFIPSGKIFYGTSKSAYTAGRTLFIRDYSNPRGTVREAIRLWSPDVFVSTRIYLRSVGDMHLERFMELLRQDPAFFANVIRENSVLSSGQVISLLDN